MQTPRHKILMTADTVGGVWTYALELSRALAPAGCEVLLATMGAPPSADQQAEAAAVPNLRVAASAYKLEWMDDPWDDLAAAGAWLLDLAAEWQPDIIHLNGYAHAALPWGAPTVVVAHSCVLSWWRAVHGEDAPAAWDTYRSAVSAGLRAADLVVAPTAAMLAELARCYGQLAATAVINNGRDPALARLAPKQPHVLAAGRLWDSAKNLAALDAVAADLAWPVYIAGCDRHPEGGVAPHRHVRPLGTLPFAELSERLGQAAIYALPARYEPFGLSVLEAAQAGCALVLGDIPSLRELWGEDALYVRPDDHAALRAALELLIDDARLRASLAQRAHERSQQWTPARMAAGYLAAYAQVAQELRELVIG
jgi:glycogen(starch) synthase